MYMLCVYQSIVTYSLRVQLRFVSNVEQLPPSAVFSVIFLKYPQIQCHVYTCIYVEVYPIKIKLMLEVYPRQITLF